MGDVPLEDDHGACARLDRVPAADIGVGVVAGPEALADVGRIVEAHCPAMQGRVRAVMPVSTEKDGSAQFPERNS
ncbi:hypothetical protein OIU14_02245 [Thalassobacter stenotrophicus]|nr:hypothetical protein OIU14_02245 [Thalassobacter stenotrophicus]